MTNYEYSYLCEHCLIGVNVADLAALSLHDLHPSFLLPPPHSVISYLIYVTGAEFMEEVSFDFPVICLFWNNFLSPSSYVFD